MRPHSHQLRTHRQSLPQHTYDICVCCHQRHPRLAGDLVKQTMQEGLFGLFTRGVEIIEGYVLMPDHMHLILKLGDGPPLEVVLRELKKYTALRGNRALGRSGAFWQDGYRERLIRSRSELEARLDYIMHNPIRTGLAQELCEYPWARCGPWDRLTVTRESFFGGGQ